MEGRKEKKQGKKGRCINEEKEREREEGRDIEIDR